MTNNQIKLAHKNGTIAMLYEQEVNKLIRQRYTISNEFAILRKKDTEPAAFLSYNTFAEECKAKVKAQINALGIIF